MGRKKDKLINVINCCFTNQPNKVLLVDIFQIRHVAAIPSYYVLRWFASALDMKDCFHRIP